MLYFLLRSQVDNAQFLAFLKFTHVVTGTNVVGSESHRECKEVEKIKKRSELNMLKAFHRDC